MKERDDEEKDGMGRKTGKDRREGSKGNRHVNVKYRKGFERNEARTVFLPVVAAPQVKVPPLEHRTPAIVQRSAKNKVNVLHS